MINLPNFWGIIRESKESLRFRFKTQPRSPFSPALLYMRYLATVNRENQSRNSVNAIGQEIHEFRNDEQTIETVDIYKMYKKKKEEEKATKKATETPATESIGQHLGVAPTNNFWKKAYSKLSGKQISPLLVIDDSVAEEMRKHPQVIESRSNFAYYTPSDDPYEMRLENFWIESRNRAVAEKKEAEEFKSVLEEWASAKSRISQEISRKIDSVKNASLMKERCFAPSLRPLSSYSSNPRVKNSMGSFNTTQATRLVNNQALGNSNRGVRPVSAQNEIKRIRPSTAVQNGQRVQGSGPGLPPAPGSRPVTGALTRASISQGIRQDSSIGNEKSQYERDISSALSHIVGRNQSARPKTATAPKRVIENMPSEIEMCKDKIQSIRRMYGDLMSLKPEEQEKTETIEHKSLSAYGKTDKPIQRPFSAVFQHPAVSDQELVEEAEIASVYERFAQMGKKIPPSLERALRHPYIDRETTAGTLPKPGNNLISNPMLVPKKTRRRPASTNKRK